MRTKRQSRNLLRDWYVAKNNPKRFYTYHIDKGKDDVAAGKILKDSELLINLAELNTSNIRRIKHFRQKGHEGAQNVDHGEVVKLDEKHLAYALFNLSKSVEFPFIGKIIDYEVPLKEKQNGSDGAVEGKIDLVSIKEHELFLIELKNYNCKESLLRAVLEIYTYAQFLKPVTEKFIKEYIAPDCDLGLYRITRVIMIFEGSVPREHLRQLEENKMKNLGKLITELNGNFNSTVFNPIKFIVISLKDHEIKLIKSNKKTSAGKRLIIFRNEIELGNNINTYFKDISIPRA
jgi:hypothetical protein